MSGSRQDLISRKALYLPVIVVLQKSGLITGRDRSRRSIGFEELGVIFLRVRLAPGATRRLECGKPNEARQLQTHTFQSPLGSDPAREAITASHGARSRGLRTLITGFTKRIGKLAAESERCAGLCCAKVT
jgi:hypothetical protein